jgi:hypothetical protein
MLVSTQVTIFREMPTSGDSAKSYTGVFIVAQQQLIYVCAGQVHVQFSNLRAPSRHQEFSVCIYGFHQIPLVATKADAKMGGSAPSM